MKLKVKNVLGEVVGDVEVTESVFGATANPAVVHQVMVGQLANARQGTATTKSRSQVSGGGAKPRPQKGSGRSRQGTTRAPQWRGGGTAFGPVLRSYRHHTPRRMKRLSLVTVLSDKVRENRLVVLDSLVLSSPKTKEMMKALDALDAGASVLLVADGAERSVLRCARNIPRVKMMPALILNTVDLLNHRTVVMTLDALRKVEETWGRRMARRTREPFAAPSEDEADAEL